MQTIVTLLFLTFASNIFAQTNLLTGGYGYGSEPPNPAQSCISTICGAPPQSNLYMTKYLDHIADFSQLAGDPKKIDFSQSTSKLFSDLIAEDDKQNELSISLFKKSSNMGSAQPVGISKALYNVSYVSPFLKKIKYKETMVNGKPEYTIDETAFMAELKDLSADDRSWVLQVAKHYVAQSGGLLSDNEIQSKPPVILLKMLHPGNSLAEGLRAELSQAQSSVASLKNLSPLEKAIYFNKTSPDRVAFIATHIEQGTVDENETREIIQFNRTYKIINNIFRSPDSPLLKRPTPTIEEIIKKGGGVDGIVKSFSDDRAKERQKDKGKILSCKMQYFLNKRILPTKDQIDILKQDIVRSKQMVQEMIKTKFPSSMQQKLFKAVEDADFVMPPTAVDFEKTFADSIRQKLEIQKQSTVALNSVPPSEIRQFLSAFSLTDGAKNSNEKSDSNEYCDAFNYMPMSDENNTTYGSIILSFTTATGDETSRMKTLMHELGHSVSKAIAEDPEYSKQFTSVRNCLRDQHTEEFPPQTKKNYEDAKATDPMAIAPYTEEDFADTIAGNSGRTIKGRNSWCQLMSLTYDRQQYQESKMQADDGEPHSASLFRLLYFEMMKKGKLPDSCKSYFKAAKFTSHFSSCFDLANPKAPLSTQPSRIVR